MAFTLVTHISSIFGIAVFIKLFCSIVVFSPPPNFPLYQLPDAYICLVTQNNIAQIMDLEKPYLLLNQVNYPYPNPFHLLLGM